MQRDQNDPALQGILTHRRIVEETYAVPDADRFIDPDEECDDGLDGPDESRVVYVADQNIDEVEELYGAIIPAVQPETLQLFLPVTVR